MVYTAWFIWQARNEFVFQRKHINACEVVVKSTSAVRECFNNRPHQDTEIQSSPHWKPPPPGCIKLNTDASFDQTSKRAGIAAIIWDNNGNFVHGAAGVCFTNFPESAEALAIKMGL